MKETHHFLVNSDQCGMAIVVLLFTQFSSENFRVMYSVVHTFAYIRALIYVSAPFKFLSLSISMCNM